MRGQRQQASPEALLAVLRALGEPLGSSADAPAALAERRRAARRQTCEPVAVAWEGSAGPLALHLPAGAAGSVGCRLDLEDGTVRQWSVPVQDLPYGARGGGRVERRLHLPEGLPLGYHRLRIEPPGGGAAEVLVISSPRRAWQPNGRGWGVFLPLYALRSARSWGAGSLSDLAELAAWAGGLGAAVVGTLPLLAAFLDEPCVDSPYSPASRLFWNEFYVDPTAAPELAACAPARDLLASPGVRREIAALRAAPLVDYRRGMALRRRVLWELARCCREQDGPRRRALEAWLAGRADVVDYARFRAAGERWRALWPDWPAPARDGRLRPGDWDPDAEGYHAYVQWLAEEQLAAASGPGRAGLYLDLPLGTHGGGYDVWRHRSSFAEGVDCGAPPDPLFAGGQDWGFPPLHPDGLRRDGYRYLRACLAHHLRRAAALRLDHVMGLHRTYWVPRGMAATDGVYVRCRAEEMYAVLTLESQRHRALLVGEDLGTVPDYVRPAMAGHGLHRLYVLPFEGPPAAEAGTAAEPAAEAASPVPAASVAGLDTHDVPPFAAWWRGLAGDERDRWRHALGMAEPAGEGGGEEGRGDGGRGEGGRGEAGRGEAGRGEGGRGEAGRGEAGGAAERPGDEGAGSSDARAALLALLRFLAASPAALLLLNLEDAWLEERSQNVPGTGPDLPNWRRRAARSLEEITRFPEVQQALDEVRVGRG